MLVRHAFQRHSGQNSRSSRFTWTRCSPCIILFLSILSQEQRHALFTICETTLATYAAAILFFNAISFADCATSARIAKFFTPSKTTENLCTIVLPYYGRGKQCHRWKRIFIVVIGSYIIDKVVSHFFARL